MLVVADHKTVADNALIALKEEEQKSFAKARE
jgi:hypothetical protein